MELMGEFFPLLITLSCRENLCSQSSTWRNADRISIFNFPLIKDDDGRSERMPLKMKQREKKKKKDPGGTFI